MERSVTLTEPELAADNLGFFRWGSIGGRVLVTMTLTAQGCPLHESLAEWVRRAIREVPGVEDVEVVVTFDPLWTPARMMGDAPR